jgi:hypothetical protein
MIDNDAQLQQACEAMTDLYRVLASYRTRVFAANEGNYALLAQGPLEEIRKIQAEIDAYLGLDGLWAAGSQFDARQSAEALREDAPHYE